MGINLLRKASIQYPFKNKPIRYSNIWRDKYSFQRFSVISAVKDIEASGFLSQQKRLGGTNFCSKRNIYRQKSSRQIWIKFEDAKKASKDGITFFGNRFTEVFFLHWSMGIRQMEW